MTVDHDDTTPDDVDTSLTSRRREILREAVRLFRRNGYHATAMDDIGGAVGLTGPALYRHFPSKESILETAMLRGADMMEQRVADIIASASGPRDLLERLVRDLVEVLIESPAIVTIAETERRYLSDRARSIYDRSARLRMTEWVSPLVELRPELDEAEAHLTVAVTQGLVQQAAWGSGSMDATRLRELLFSSAMHSLLHRRGLDVPASHVQEDVA